MYNIFISVLSLISKNERNTMLTNIYKIIDNSDLHISPTYLAGGFRRIFVPVAFCWGGGGGVGQAYNMSTLFYSSFFSFLVVLFLYKDCS